MLGQGNLVPRVYFTCHCGMQLVHERRERREERVQVECADCGGVWEIRVTERGWVKIPVRGPTPQQV